MARVLKNRTHWKSATMKEASFETTTSVYQQLKFSSFLQVIEFETY